MTIFLNQPSGQHPEENPNQPLDKYKQLDTSLAAKQPLQRIVLEDGSWYYVAEERAQREFMKNGGHVGGERQYVKGGTN